MFEAAVIVLLLLILLGLKNIHTVVRGLITHTPIPKYEVAFRIKVDLTLSDELIREIEKLVPEYTFGIDSEVSRSILPIGVDEPKRTAETTTIKMYYISKSSL